MFCVTCQVLITEYNINFFNNVGSIVDFMESSIIFKVYVCIIKLSFNKHNYLLPNMNIKNMSSYDMEGVWT